MRRYYTLTAMAMALSLVPLAAEAKQSEEVRALKAQLKEAQKRDKAARAQEKLKAAEERAKDAQERVEELRAEVK